MARMASAIANKGVMKENRYVMKVSESLLPLKEGITIINEPAAAQLLTTYMRSQSETKVNRLHMYVAGKTGTPERMVRGRRINDGWYVFFAPKASGSGHIVVCVRVENTRGSSVAVNLAGTHVIPALLKRGYITGFEKAGQNNGR